MRSCRIFSMSALSLSLMGVLGSAPAWSQSDINSYVLDTEVRITTDQRMRGVSDSLNGPSAKLALQWAHESGISALAEINSVSKRQFVGGSGVAMVLGLGYRWGDPEGWHYGVGLAAELFPGAGVEAPHSLNPDTFESQDFRRTRFNSTLAALEVGWGNLDARVMNVLSRDYRGISTGTVCGTLLALRADPTAGLECYGRGDRSARGSWLLDLSYKMHLNVTTTLVAHVGHQQVRNFREANITDYSLALKHQRWGAEWTAEWISPRTKARELYQVADGTRLRATDNNRLVLSVGYKF